jgi:uncharacterized damage-inducible protein DinB/GNAT superfamily N-acetyltransferase
MSSLARFVIRPLAARDSLGALTDLLHRAYAPLAARGMNFTAADQSVEQTRRRVADGQCWVAEAGGAIVGTVTVCGPYDPAQAPLAAEAPWFRDSETAHFQQFAVDPSAQGQGLGRRLVATCETWAREHRYRWLALDTAEPAGELRTLYARLGYRDVGHVQWPGKSYRSVVMRKALDRSALREQLETMAQYNLWATRRLCAALEPLPEADYRRDVGLFFKSIHGTLNHLLLGEGELWFKRFQGQAPNAVWTSLAQEVEPDRARLQRRLLEGTAAWLPALEGWGESRLAQDLVYTSMNGEALTLPFAATLMHVFNHGTHHRGQITAALTMLGQPCPELDLVVMLRDRQR